MVGMSEMGHERPPALHKNREPFRRRPSMMSVADLPIGA